MDDVVIVLPLGPTLADAFHSFFQDMWLDQPMNLNQFIIKVM